MVAQHWTQKVAQHATKTLMANYCFMREKGREPRSIERGEKSVHFGLQLFVLLTRPRRAPRGSGVFGVSTGGTRCELGYKQSNSRPRWREKNGR